MSSKEKALKKQYPKYTSISNDKKQIKKEHLTMDKAHRKAYDKGQVSY